MEVISLFFQNFTRLKIFNQYAWSILLLNRSIKILVFILYSWFIYQSFAFMVLLVGFCEKPRLITFRIVENILYMFFGFPIYIAYGLLLNKFKYDLTYLTLFLIGLYAIVILLWLKKQTIIRAWILALTGLIAGVGPFYWLPAFIGFEGVIVFIGTNLFYLLLYVCNLTQKRFWPNNKFANRMRSILKWPCLRA